MAVLLIGGGVSGGEVLQAEADDLQRGRGMKEEMEGENLLAGFAEILR